MLSHCITSYTTANDAQSTTFECGCRVEVTNPQICPHSQAFSCRIVIRPCLSAECTQAPHTSRPPSPTVSRQTEERVRDETPPTLETPPAPEPSPVPIISHRFRAVDLNNQVVAPKDRVKPAKSVKSKPKDPDQPKRPPAAFILFQSDIRESTKVQFPGLSMVELVKVMATKWDALPAEKRKWYTNRATAEMDQWKAQMRVYKQLSLTKDKANPPLRSETKRSPPPKRRRIGPISDGERAV